MSRGRDPGPQRGLATGLLALAGAVVLAGLVPAGAAGQTATIGADLNRPVTANYGCEIRPPFGFPGANSCTWLGTPAPPIKNGRARAEASMGRCLGGVSFRGGRLGDSAVVIPLDCNIGAGCRGTITLLGGRGAQASAKLGGAKFRAKAGKRKKVKVKLTRAGKRALRGRNSVRLKAKAKIKGGPNETGKVKLKR